MKSIHIIVSGRVQGVCFRAFTQKQAKKLGIFGYVNNNADGQVEIVAVAEQEKLEHFINGCHKGPLMAKVSHVLVTAYDSTEKFTQFEIR